MVENLEITYIRNRQWMNNKKTGITAEDLNISLKTPMAKQRGFMQASKRALVCFIFSFHYF